MRRARNRRRRQIAEERDLSGRPIAVRGSGGRQRLLDAGEKLGAFALEEIKGTGFDQALDDFAVGEARIEPAAKIFQRAEVPSPLTFRDRGGHGAFADILDRGESVTDGGEHFNVGAASAPRSSVTPSGRTGPSHVSDISGVNFKLLRFMSGGRIGMPIRLHSPTKTEILSVLLISLLNKPAMNSTG